MGFLNHLFGKKENTESKKEAETSIKEETEKEEIKKDDYTFMVEQVFSVKTGGCIVAGIVRNADILLGDEIYILGRGKSTLHSKVQGLENPETGKQQTAAKGSPVGILLENIEGSQIHRGDIITNIEPNTEDVNKPMENPRLKGLMRQVAGNPSEEMMNLVYEEVAMNARFLAVMMLSEEPEAGEDGMATFKKDSVMQLPLLTAPDGTKFYPVFTDWRELGKWEDMKEPKTLLLSFDDYAALVLQNEDIRGIVINPFSENMMAERALVEHLKMKKELLIKGASMQQTEKDIQVSLGDPVKLPEEMVKVISETLKKEPCVAKAWLRLMKRGEEISYLLVADIGLPGNQETIFENIANTVRPYLNGMRINMITYQKEFGKNAAEGVQPFYKKQA